MRLSFLYAKFIRKYVVGKAVTNSSIHKTSIIGPGSNIVNVTMDRYSYCGYDCQIVNTVIGSFCSISDHVFIGGAEHPMDWVSTSPVFQNVRHSGPKKRFAMFDLPKSKRTIIGNDVWIGHGVTIKQGIHIGDGAVVGSNALVTKDVPPYAIVGGVPAKVIKYRFEENTITKLVESKWWNLSDDELQQDAKLIQYPELFVSQLVDNNKQIDGGGGGVNHRLSTSYKNIDLERRAA